MNRVVVAFLCVLSFAAAWFWQGWRKDHQNSDAAIASSAKAAALQTQIDQFKGDALRDRKEAADNAVKIKAHEGTISNLRAAMNLSRIPQLLPSNAPVDLQLAQLAPLQVHSNACEELVKELDAQVVDFRAQAQALTSESDNYRRALELAEQRGNALLTTATLPKYDAGLGSFIDTVAHRVRPAIVINTHLTRNTILGSAIIPGAGVMITATYSWGHL